MQIKSQLGKIRFSVPVASIVSHQQRKNQLRLLSIELNHVLALETLPLHHHDPFDRLLIAQATMEQAVLLSRDMIFHRYPVDVRW
jgi:PIN domain nuclease of toxin-antitoxin system